MTAHVAWIVVAAQLVAAIGHADPAADQALVHLDRGVAAYRAGDLARAHAELAAASALAPDRPNPYRWLALTEVELGDCRSALVNIESFLSRVPAGDPRVAEVVALRGRCLAPGPASGPMTGPATGPASGTPSLQRTAEPAAPAVYQRGWFWVAIGAVAITAAGVTYGLTRGGDARLPPVTCDPAGCHP